MSGRRPLVVAALVAVLLAAACSRDDLPEATPLCDLGRNNDQGVVGHDLAASAALPDGRVLFAFGDTYLGRITGGERVATGLLNSTGAVIPAGDDVCSDRIRYLTGDDGEPRALLPDPPREATAFWPVDLAVHDGRVWMLYRWVERTGDGRLDIGTLGTGLAVADPDELEFTPADRLLVVGGIPVPSSLREHDGRLVALVCVGGDDRDCRLREVDTDATEIGEALPGPPIDLSAAEMGLGRVDVGGRQVWQVSSMPGLACRLQVARFIDDEWWTETVLAPDTDDGALCYAGRVQEPYSTADTLTVTWVQSPERRRNADAYWPHVERVDLTEE
ncbi:hypothetical protein BH24ACT4_BH24ACT4_08640 [soil metagenome]